MKKLLFYAFVINCIKISVFSQSVYEIDIKQEAVISTISLGAALSPFFIQNKPDIVPSALNKNDVNGLDRFFMFPANGSLDLFSDHFYAVTLASLPLVSVIPFIKQKNVLLTYGIMYAQSLLLTYGTVFSLKNAVIRYRPYMYAGIPARLKNDYHKSLPSSSSAFSFLGTTFFCTTFSHEFPESKWKLPIIIGSSALAAGTGLMRIASGAHFLSDVLTGAAIGSLYGWLIPQLHLKKGDAGCSVEPTVNGVMLSLKF